LDAYGISFDEVLKTPLSSEMITVMNRRASAFHLFIWTKGEKSAYRDDVIIASWKEGPNISFDEESENKRKFDEIADLFGSSE